MRLLAGLDPQRHFTQQKQVSVLDQGQQFELAVAKYRNDPEAADALLSVGEYPLAENLDIMNTAALTMVANTMMNFDETYMKR